ncbi:MAG: hypothetical protein N3B13_06330 [Deltaproteobacteria bacterium]|nr:hypothetical protein [Deltaproteobacteria bacterium]
MRSDMVVFLILVFISACIVNDNGGGASAYEVFVASVDRILVEQEINVSQPVRIGIDGHFDDDCSELARIAVEKSDSPNNIELTVYGKRKINIKCNSKEVIYFGSITITGLSEGRYRVRINGDNNLIKYFSVVKGNNQDASIDMDSGSDCIEEVAPLGMADITVDGFNSARNQKIPYGTPISLIVKGSISGECRGFKGFRYDKLGSNIYIDVLAEYCPSVCNNDYRNYSQTYVLTGLAKGKYTLYVNSLVEIKFEITE